MDQGLELIIPILEILEVEVSNILHNPGNIGNLSFPIFYYPGNIGDLNFPIFSYPGSSGQVFPAWIIFGTWFLEFPDILEILEI